MLKLKNSWNFIKILLFIFTLNSAFCEKWTGQNDLLSKDPNFNPINYYFNTGYDVLQNPTYFNSNNLLENYKLFFKRTINPFKGIKDDGGLKKFLKDEIIGSIRVLPNYGLHLVGNGFDFLKLHQWYKKNDYSYPLALSLTTSLFATFLNEALEASFSEIGAHDHIADVWIFDLASRFLFYYSESFRNFFLDEMQLSSWTYQPIYNFQNGKFYNTGVNYVLKPKILQDKIGGFLAVGMQIFPGIYYNATKKDRLYFSIGSTPVDPLNGVYRVPFAFFWEKNDILVYSIVINGGDNLYFKQNIYPGWSKNNFLKKLGVFFGHNRDKKLEYGIHYNSTIGLSFF